MSAVSGLYGTAGVMASAIQDGSHAASYTHQTNPQANALYDVLGLPEKHIPADAYAGRMRTNLTLLDAYKGRNALLSDTVEGLILADNEVQTTIMFPWVYTEEKNFKFNKIIFNRALPGPTPHESTSRLITMGESSQSYTSQRYGIKFRMEGDFAETTKGKAAFARYLQAVSQSIQELANYGADAEVLNCKNYQKEYSDQHRERGTQWKQIINNECSDFAAACVDADQLELIIERNRTVLTARKITPDLILAPPGSKLFFSMVSHGTRTGYDVFGPDGASTFVEGPRAAGILRGDLIVFEAREYDLNVGGPAIMPLERPTTVGECYPMSFGYRRGTPLEGSNSYQTGQRDKYIYDFTADDYKKVSFAKAFLYAGLWDNQTGLPDRRFQAKVAAYNSYLNGSYPGLKDNLAMYASNMVAHDTLGAEEEHVRYVPIFVAHDGDKYIVPTTLGEMDIDAINTSDFLQMADSIREKSKTDAGKAKYNDILNKCQKAGGSSGIVDFVLRTVGARSAVEGASSYSPIVFSSPAHLMPLRSNAALIFGALSQGAIAEAHIYSPIDTENLTLRAPVAGNKLAAWLATVQKSASSGVEDAAYKKAIQERVKVLSKITRAIDTANAANILTVRENLAKAIDDNVASNGGYQEGRTFSTFDKDLNEVASKAKDAKEHPDLLASQVLYEHRSQMAVNPFGENIPVERLSAAQIAAITPAFDEFFSTAGTMEDRIILHGNAHKFDASKPLDWVNSIKASTESEEKSLKQTRSVAEAFAAAHSKFNDAVTEHIISSAELFSKESSQKVQASIAGRTVNMSYRLGDALTKVGPENLEIYAKLLNIRNERDCWQMLINADIHVPINLILWRPWIRHRMYTMVMMRSGLETGGTIYGHANFVISGEGMTKTLEAHMTFNYATICWNEKAVIHMENVLPRGYMGGWNNRFIESKDEIFEVAEEDRGSIVVTAVPITENTWRFPINFTPTQRYINSSTGVTGDYKDKIALYGAYSGGEFYEDMWELKNTVLFSEAHDTYSTKYKYPNTIAFLGNSFDYDTQAKKFSFFRGGNGHLAGNKTGRGCAATWNGNLKMFPDQSKIMYNLP